MIQVLFDTNVDLSIIRVLYVDPTTNEMVFTTITAYVPTPIVLSTPPSLGSATTTPPSSVFIFASLLLATVILVVMV